MTELELVAGANATLPGGTGIESTANPGEGARQTIDPRAAVTRVQVAVVVTATAYEALDAVGGVITFANVAREAGSSVRIEALQLVDKDAQVVAYNLLLFRAAPTATDEAGFDPSDAELLDFCGIIPIGAGDWQTLTDNAVAHVDVGLTVDTGASDDLFGVLVAVGTPTFTSTSALTITLTAQQD